MLKYSFVFCKYMYDVLVIVCNALYYDNVQTSGISKRTP